MTETEELAAARRLLGWIYQRSRNGCFSGLRTERDAALSDINFHSSRFSMYWRPDSGQQPNPNAIWCGESP